MQSILGSHLGDSNRQWTYVYKANNADGYQLFVRIRDLLGYKFSEKAQRC